MTESKKPNKNWLVKEPKRATAKEDFEVIKKPSGRPQGSKNKPSSKRKSIGDDDSLASLVEMMTACGLSHNKQAGILKIHPETLRRNFKDELDNGDVRANMKVAQALFRKAIEGDVRAQMFWLKAKGGFIEKNELDLKSSLADTMSPTEKGQRLGAILFSDPALLAKFRMPKEDDLPAKLQAPIDVYKEED